MAYENKKFTPLKVELLLEEENAIMITPCPSVPVAQASEVKLAQLSAYKKINILGADNE